MYVRIFYFTRLQGPERPVGLDGNRHAVELLSEGHLTRHPADRRGILRHVLQKRAVVQVHLRQLRHDIRGQRHVGVGTAHGGNHRACVCFRCPGTRGETHGDGDACALGRGDGGGLVESGGNGGVWWGKKKGGRCGFVLLRKFHSELSSCTPHVFWFFSMAD